MRDSLLPPIVGPWPPWGDETATEEAERLRQRYVGALASPLLLVQFRAECDALRRAWDRRRGISESDRETAEALLDTCERAFVAALAHEVAHRDDPYTYLSAVLPPGEGRRKAETP